ncbi:MAG: HAD-IIIA family hydrolase [Nitrospirae bacterium]|nr:HAD-IIIA family hydrolase [Nitrospirota bacterium]
MIPSSDDSDAEQRLRERAIRAIIVNENIIQAARRIKLLILDVDGVMTSGGIILDNEGNEFKSFHVRDGQGIKLLRDNGINVAILTGRLSKVVDRRAAELGIVDVFQCRSSKLGAYEELKAKYGLSDDEIACVGDDLADLPLLVRGGLPVSVPEAGIEVKNRAMLVTKAGGGRGAVREVCEIILKAKGLWDSLIEDLCR